MRCARSDARRPGETPSIAIPSQHADRERADDRLRAQLLAACEAERGTGREIDHGRDDGARAGCGRRARRHALGDLGAALGDLERLPALVRVEALARAPPPTCAARRARTSLDRPSASSSAPPRAARIDGRARVHRPQPGADRERGRAARHPDATTGRPGRRLPRACRTAARPARSPSLGRRRRGTASESPRSTPSSRS